MPKRFVPPPAPAPDLPAQLRLLYALERPAGWVSPDDPDDTRPVWEAGEIIPAAFLPAASIPILMECGIVMPYLDPAHLAALPAI